MEPLLSILVATRNRIPYCINLIETILSFEYENFELVIQDNSDTLELSDYAQTIFNDKRFLYNYTSDEISSIDNFNKVIDLAKGDYLCMIGDDDGVRSEIFKLAEWMKDNGIDAVKPSLSLMYRWPDACELLPGYKGDGGNLSVAKVSGVITFVNTKKELQKLLEEGCQNYLQRQLPKLYHGIVKRQHLISIRKETGNYAGGLSPDIYWVISLSKHIKNVCVIDYPFTIPGVCAEPIKQGGHLSKIDKLENAPHFRNRENYKWSKNIPRFYCAENIWADTANAAMKENFMNKELKDFNLLYLSTLLYIKYPESRKAITSNYSQNSKNIISRNMPEFVIMLNSYFFNIILLFGKVINKILRSNSHFKVSHPLNTTSTFKNVTCIYDACQVIATDNLANGVSFDKIISTYKHKETR